MALILPHRDTRRYSSSRLYSLFDYDTAPVIDGGLLSRLPQLSQRVGRTVKINSQEWEAWSPNSSVTPFLPGLAASAAPPAPSPILFLDTPLPDWEQRRYDGHLGRFDYTVSPQQFSPIAPWKGFILRSSTAPGKLPEFWPICEYWEQELIPAMFDYGRISPIWVDAISRRVVELETLCQGCIAIAVKRSDLWDRRPQLPSSIHLNYVMEIRMYDVAVDAARAMQRIIIEVDGWQRWAHAVLGDTEPYNAEQWLHLPILPAVDHWLGVWINGADEKSVLEALRMRVPCFIVHEFTQTDLNALIQPLVSDPNFIYRSDAALLTKRDNLLEMCALRLGCRSTKSRAIPRAPAIPPPRSDSKRAASASSAHGWKD
jgi:hypothetical protein